MTPPAVWSWLSRERDLEARCDAIFRRLWFVIRGTVRIGELW